MAMPDRYHPAKHFPLFIFPRETPTKKCDRFNSLELNSRPYLGPSVLSGVDNSACRSGSSIPFLLIWSVAFVDANGFIVWHVWLPGFAMLMFLVTGRETRKNASQGWNQYKRKTDQLVLTTMAVQMAVSSF